MKKTILLFCIIFYYFLSQSQDTWIQKDSVNGPPRSSCASFVLNGEGFVVGGIDIIEFKRKMYSYDVEQDDWDNELSVGGINGAGLNRGGAIAFATNTKGYVGLGQGNGVPFFNDLWEYDPISNTWTQKASFIGSSRRLAVCFEINGIAYVGTGQDANGFTKDFYKYDASTNSWTQIADFGGSARKGAVGFSMGNQGYVGTGDEGILVNDFWQYNPSTDTWTEKASFPGSARSGASGWGIFPTAFIACGYDNSFNYKKDVWEYNYFSNTWTQRSNFDGPKRTSATAFVIDGIAYLGLGYNGSFLDDFWAYTPILSVDEYKNTLTLYTYPNPTTDFVTFNLNFNFDSNYQLNLFNSNGQSINSLINVQIIGTQLLIDLSSVPKGIYFYQFLVPDDLINFTGKLIVQ
ncbi:MAG TPA: T9SS type A sorting domain-containing protein [Crocinitomix sp.]|nr:T9SS type A sorting domain-containing protein [Crocinitomix sp.]